jgi:hypothetical protein
VGSVAQDEWREIEDLLKAVPKAFLRAHDVRAGLVAMGPDERRAATQRLRAVVGAKTPGCRMGCAANRQPQSCWVVRLLAARRAWRILLTNADQPPWSRRWKPTSARRRRRAWRV